MLVAFSKTLFFSFKAEDTAADVAAEDTGAVAAAAEVRVRFYFHLCSTGLFGFLELFWGFGIYLMKIFFSLTFFCFLVALANI